MRSVPKDANTAPKPKRTNTHVVDGAYADEAASALHCGLSRDGFRRHVRAGVFPKAIFLKVGGKGMWRVRDLDAAFDKAARSRRPRREPRGIVRERMEAANAR